MAGFLFNYFQSVNHYTELNCNPKCLLMKEILRFNTTDKRMEDRLKDASSRGLVYNTLKTREGYYARLEKFRAANPSFLDEI
jgi:hypothetical protein